MTPSPLHPAAQAETELLTDCDIDRQRRRGPGGQHRNKVETAVVIRHRPTGVTGEASERRHQQQNRRQALFRLRVNLALNVRCAAAPQRPSEVWRSRCVGGRIRVSANHLLFPAVLAEALDVLSRHDTDVAAAARFLGCTPSQLVKLLQREPRALEQVNRVRVGKGLKRLR